MQLKLSACRAAMLYPGLCMATVATVATANAATRVDEATTLERVQVEAARVRSVDPFDLPASLDSIDSSDSANRAQLQVSEALSGVVGVSARERQNLAQDTQLSIRGFGARSTFGVRGVRIYSDGIPATMPDGQGQLSHLNLFGSERIDVLRGPFSALYGNSSGGVVQLWSADGEAGDPWRLRTSIGSNGTAATAVQLRGAAANAHYNIAAGHFRTDGWRDHSAARRTSLNGRIGFDLASGDRLDVVFNAFDAPRAQDPLGLDRDQVREDPRQATAVATQYNTRKSVRQHQAGLVFTRERGDHTLRLSGHAGRRSVEQFLAIPPGPQNSPLHAGGVIDLDGNYGGVDARWAWEGQLANRPLHLVAGANADQQRQHRTGYENFIADALGVTGRMRRDQRDQVRNVDQFAQAWWQAADRWSVLLGVRHSEVRFRSDDRYVTASNPDDSGRRTFSAMTPVAGVVFHLDDDTRLYASAGRGFETPTFNELGYRADGGAGLALDLSPARSRNLEFGARWRHHSGARAQLAVFRADTDDELAVATNAGGRSTYRSLGQTRREGVEASWLQPLGETAALHLAWTWLDATVRDGYLTCTGRPAPCTTPTNPVAAGTALPGVARQQGMLRWQWQPRTWQMAAEVVAAAGMPVNDLGDERAAGYGLLNLELARRWETAAGPLRVFARIDNALDRRYIGSIIVNDGNRRYYEPGPDRSWMLGLEWQWAR